MELKSRLDLTEIFCYLDDFSRNFEHYCRSIPQLTVIALRAIAEPIAVETVNDQLKNISQIEHSRHRSVWNFIVNLFSGLIAYTYLPKKPSLDLEPKGFPALPPALF